LKTDYLDLLLIHWPGVNDVRSDSPENRTIRHDSWRALEKLYQEGKVRSIGVSNFLIRHLEPLLQVANVVPHVNQFEYHPLCHDDELVNYCNENNIVVEAYSSLARGEAKLFKNNQIKDIADSKGASIA